MFESPIDLLSHASLQYRDGLSNQLDNRIGTGAAGHILGGEGGWNNWDGHRLSLGGTSDVALISFLKRNPQINRIMLHLDNDVAGLTAAGRIKTELAAGNRFKHIKVSINPPKHGAKDYNDALLHEVSKERELRQLHRQLHSSL